MTPAEIEISEPVSLAIIGQVIGPLVSIALAPAIAWLVMRRSRRDAASVRAAARRVEKSAQDLASTDTGSISTVLSTIQEHVANSHQTNLRDDIDGLDAKLGVVLRQQGLVYDRLGAIDAKHDGLRASLDEHIAQGAAETAALREDVDQVMDHITKGRE